MFYTYILHCADGQLYTGYTPDLKNRMKAHEGGFVFSTKHRLPLRLIHYEAYLEESDAKRRELYLKGGNGKKEIEKMLEDYFQKNPWNKTTEKPIPPPTVAKDGTIICPICHGKGEAPTRSYFGRNGDRKSGFIGFCQTCKGKGRIPKQQRESGNTTNSFS